MEFVNRLSVGYFLCVVMLLNIKATRNSINEPNSSVLNQNETINQNDLEEENRELQELLA